MIEIDDGIFLFPQHATLVKAAGKKECVLYVSGQSALEGFLVKRPAADVAMEIFDYMNGTEPDVVDEEEDIEEAE